LTDDRRRLLRLLEKDAQPSVPVALGLSGNPKVDAFIRGVGKYFADVARPAGSPRNRTDESIGQSVFRRDDPNFLEPVEKAAGVAQHPMKII
jgi:hypothetical protein